MLSVRDIVSDATFLAPQPFQILRSVGSWIAGVFQSSTTILTLTGPVQRATDEEVQMLPEADRTSAVMSFWSTVPIYVTRGASPQLGGADQVLSGSGQTLQLQYSVTSGVLTKNGLVQIPGIDYTLAGLTITLAVAAISSDVFMYTTVVGLTDSSSAADILVYPPNSEQYRILSVRHHPGSGYWKALGTKMSAS